MEEKTATETLPVEREPRRAWLALIVLSMGQFMLSLDDTVVNVALPSIQGTLSFDQAGLVWVVNIYVLCFGGFLLLGGRVADLLGRRRVFLFGITLFAFASALCGTATSAGGLVAARALQGLSGAFVAPAGLALVATTFRHPGDRAKALGLWGGITGVGMTMGIFVGGALTDLISWRWIFFINAPLGLITILGTLQLVEPDQEVHRGSFDILGAISITGGICLSLFALLQGERDGLTPMVQTALILGVALLVSFVILEQKVREPLVPMEVVKRRTSIGAIVLGFLTPAAFFGMFFMLTLYLQQVLEYSPLETALAYLGFNAAVFVGFGTAGPMASRYGVRASISAGMLLAATGLLWFSRLSVDGNYWTSVLPGMLILGLGGAWCFVCVTIYAVSNVEPDKSGLVSGMLTASQQVGGAVGLGIIITAANFRTNMFEESTKAAQVGGYSAAFVVAAVFSLLGFILALAIIPRAQADARAP